MVYSSTAAFFSILHKEYLIVYFMFISSAALRPSPLVLHLERPLFRSENVKSARAGTLPDPVPPSADQ